MKLEVFEYLIAIEKYGSLNKAANNLFVSQPNLSNVIKTFENELGYPVIYRNHQGVHFTDKGKQVLLIAHNMVKEKEKLMNLNLDHQKIAFKISIGNGDYALSPIYYLLKQQSFQDEINITIVNCAVWESLENVYNQIIDIAYFIIPKSMKLEIEKYSESHHLKLYQIIESTCQIELRKNHPLLENFSKEGLWNYPFVDFVNQRPNAYEEYQQYINPHKIIEVDHHSLRKKIICETDAFSIGLPSSDPIQNHSHTVGIPTPELKMYICEVRRQSDKDHLLFNQLRNIIEKNLGKIYL
ncbi:LysR family transcriptional regulator [Beduini massiliensis]|uniref:LysR family transcriptional regulator n=1 Tax=Beduini massiliensis TaxID=1585974 RepID=UPI00094209F6|nr:LysR family transcriptional regulator [Beduini massiliensis]